MQAPRRYEPHLAMSLESVRQPLGQMVGKSIKNCLELKHFSNLVLPFVVVDEVGSYKPSREVYNHLARRVGKEHALHEVWLISG
jgi:hypothetical protein